MKLQLFQRLGKLDLGEGPQSPQETMGKLRKGRGHHQPNRVTQLVTPDLLMNQGPCFTHTPRQPLVAHWDEEGIGEDERETERMKDMDTGRQGSSAWGGHGLCLFPAVWLFLSLSVLICKVG